MTSNAVTKPRRVMKTKSTTDLHRWLQLASAASLSLLFSVQVKAVTTVFFDASQGTNLVAAGTTSDTLSSTGYLFTCTRDKLFTGGVGLTNPIGRYLRVEWPTGLEAQAVTVGPVLSKARLTLQREDGQPFAIQSLAVKLLANTAGAGAAFEIMPKLNGEDGRPDPYMYPATGYYGSQFSYQTPELSGFDTYIITLYVDYALLKLTVVDASRPPPVLEISPIAANVAQLSWPTNHAGFVLQQKTALDSTNWVAAAEPVSIAGENYQATVTLTNGPRFFRLRSTP